MVAGNRLTYSLRSSIANSSSPRDVVRGCPQDVSAPRGSSSCRLKDLVKFELEEDRDDYSSNIQDVIVDEFHKKLKTRFYSWLRRKVQSLYYILIDKTTYKPKKD